MSAKAQSSRTYTKAVPDSEVWLQAGRRCFRMSEFHDPDLRQELGRLSGPYPDDNVAFEAWQRRVGQVRRRRVMAWTTAAALSLVVGTVGVAALQSPGRHSLVPSKAGESTEVSVS